MWTRPWLQVTPRRQEVEQLQGAAKEALVAGMPGGEVKAVEMATGAMVGIGGRGWEWRVGGRRGEGEGEGGSDTQE